MSLREAFKNKNHFLNLPFRANFYPMTGLSQRYYYDLLTDLGEGRLGGPLERPTDPKCSLAY